jgi:ABC-2 type transport system permease protein
VVEGSGSLSSQHKGESSQHKGESSQHKGKAADDAMAAGGAARAAERPMRAVPAYFVTAGMWIRSEMTYRANFVLMVCTGFLVTGLDFIGILIMFGSVDSIGGYALPEVAFLYGTSSLAFAVTDLFFGSVGRAGRRVRSGSLDIFLLRPVPILAQLASDQFALRRIGRMLQAGTILGWALATVDVDWDAGRVLMLPVMVLAGAGIYLAVYLAGAAFQFWAADAAEAQNAFTFGGNFLTQYPPVIYTKEIVRGATFVIPLAFINWMPAMYVLDRQDPLGLPAFFDFASPLVAVLAVGLAGIAWRAAVRGYRSTGS